jgi:hypothetical protein
LCRIKEKDGKKLEEEQEKQQEREDLVKIKKEIEMVEISAETEVR